MTAMRHAMRALLCLLVSMASGCACLEDRGRDFLDCFQLSFSFFLLARFSLFFAEAFM